MEDLEQLEELRQLRIHKLKTELRRSLGYLNYQDKFINAETSIKEALELIQRLNMQKI